MVGGCVAFTDRIPYCVVTTPEAQFLWEDELADMPSATSETIPVTTVPWVSPELQPPVHPIQHIYGAVHRCNAQVHGLCIPAERPTWHI